MELAQINPIVLFVFNRLEETKITVDALAKNTLAKESILYIFSDGPRNKKDLKKVEDVRNYLNNIHGKFSKVIKILSNFNLKNTQDFVFFQYKLYDNGYSYFFLQKATSDMKDFFVPGGDLYNTRYGKYQEHR